MGSFNASLKTIGDTKGIPATVELQEGRLSITAGDSEIGNWSLDEVALDPTPTGYKLAAEGDQVLLEMTDSEQFGEELQASSKSGRKEKADKKKMTLFSRKEKKADEGDNQEETSATQTAPAQSAHNEPSIAASEPTSRIPASVIGASSPSPKPAPSPKPEAPSQPASSKPETDTKGPSFFGRLVALLDRTIDVTEKRWGPLLPAWVFNRIVFVAGFALVVLAFVFRGTTSIVLLVTGVLALMVGGAAYTDDVMASKLLPGRATPTHLMVVGVGLLGVGIGFGFMA